ncbi:MAG: hypothetical protein HYY17_05950 [Planctomycetes bacterium]|nr:hypothetical protein [Planctomycetota bacterium]
MIALALALVAAPSFALRAPAGRQDDDILKPQARIEVWGKIQTLVRHPEKDVVYALDVSGHRVLEIEPAKGRMSRSIEVADGAERMALAPDGKRLIVSVSTGSEAQAGALQLVDTEKMEVVRTCALPFDPFDVAAGRDLACVSGRTEGRIAVFDLKGEAVVASWNSGVPRAAFLRFSPDGGRLYLAASVADPSSPACRVPAKDPAAEPEVRRYSGRYDLGAVGEFEISHDGRFLITRTGFVLDLSADPKEDLKPRYGLRRKSLHFAAAPGARACYLSDDKGALLEYGYDSFACLRTFNLDTKAYRMITDREGRYLVAAAYPGTFRPQDAGGPGDILIYDLSRLPGKEAKPAEPAKLDGQPAADRPRDEGPTALKAQKCGECGGKRRVSWAKVEDGVRTEYSTDCLACFGSGETSAAVCPSCRGAGEEYLSGHAIVDGKVQIVHLQVECGRCKGARAVAISPYAAALRKGECAAPCAECKGTGKIAIDYKAGDRTGKIERECRACKGGGQVRFSRCATCKGEGIALKSERVMQGTVSVSVTRYVACPDCSGGGVIVALKD